MTPTLTDAAPPRPATPRQRYHEATARLAAAQKSSSGAPAYSRFVNRPLGRRFAALAHLGGLTPNGVTAISAVATFTGITLLAVLPPTWWLGLAVGALLVLGYALDAADGQLARLRGGGSLSGEWLDHMIDAAKQTTVHLAVLVTAYAHFGLDPAWLLVPLGYTVVDSLTFFALILNGLLRDRHTARTGAPVARATPSTLRSLLALPTDYGVLCLVFLTLGAPVVFAGLYTAMFVGSAGFLALAAVKWFRDIQTLDHDGAGVGTGSGAVT